MSPLLDSLRTLFRKEVAHQPEVIRFDDLPALIVKKREEAAVRLGGGTERERAGVRHDAESLSRVMQVLLAAQFNEQIHPKLKSIAQKSLPLYVKTVQAALEKPLPPEPEAFYSAAAELLKTCINSMQGQGRYLRTAFPDEMKAVASCIAGIGRAINAMNPAVSGYRATIAQIAGAERLHAALLDIDLDQAKSREKEDRMNRRMQEIRDRMAACESALPELESELRRQGLSGKEETIAQLKKERDRTARQYVALSMTAAHVLRKAENLARRQHRQSDERAVARAISLLSDHTIPDTQELVEALTAAVLPAKRMIDAGEISLKNKEERSLFSSLETFQNEIRRLCTTYADQAAACETAEREYSSHPLIVRQADLNRELRTLTDTLARQRQARDELVQWREAIVSNIPSLRQQLETAIRAILPGTDVQIRYPDDLPLPPPR